MRIQPFRQFHPENEASRRIGHARALGEAVGDQAARLIDPHRHGSAQLAQGGPAAGLVQQVGQRQLQHRRLRAGLHRLDLAQLRRPPPGLHPTEAQARRQRLAEATANHHVAGLVKRLDGAPSVFLLGQVVVNHVLNQRDIMRSHQLSQALTLQQRHAGADRVGQGRHHQHRLDRLSLQRQLQRVQRDTVARMGGDFQRPQMQALQNFQEAEIGRRL